MLLLTIILVTPGFGEAPQLVTPPLQPPSPSLGYRSVSLSSGTFVLHDNDDGDDDDDVLQVFLTVNSLAKVYWDGTFEKRRLELNWVNPPDVQREDYVGLFRVDPQWFGISSTLTIKV